MLKNGTFCIPAGSDGLQNQGSEGNCMMLKVLIEIQVLYFSQDYLHRYHRLKVSSALNRSFFHWEIDIKVFP